jgi:hypothetical protein
MSKIFLLSFFYVVFIGFSPIFPNTFYATKTNAVYDVPNEGPSLYYTSSGSTFGDVGFKYVSPNSYTTRTQYDFNLSSIPTNATITSVTLTYSGANYNNGQFHYKITQLNGNIPNPQDLWNGIGSATILIPDIYYSASSGFSNSTLVSLVNNNKAGHLYLGAISQDEASANSYATVDMHLDVQFTVPSQNISLCADNNFNVSTGNDGQIIVDGGQQTTPFNFTKATGQTAALTAISNQTDGQGYQRIWSTSAPLVNSIWKATNSSGNFQLPGTLTNINYTTASLTNNYNGVTITANLLKVCNISVQNSFVGIGNGGIIKVNGAQYNSPEAITVVEQNPITATALDQTILAIDYEFIGWYDGTASDPNANLISTESTHTFYPGGHATYYAHFIGYPNIDLMNVQNNSTVVGAHPTITWTDNINDLVTYDIYRSTSYSQNYVLAASDIQKGVHSYTENNYTNNGTPVSYLYLYVNVVYNTEQTSKATQYQSFNLGIAAPGPPPSSDKRRFSNINNDNITEYKLYDNFPNPFNPSTEIYYQIPSDGNVKLKVYNIMGQEVMTLVNGFKEKGMYNVSFNAGSLTSGVYIYKLEAGNYVQVKKMILTK